MDLHNAGAFKVTSLVPKISGQNQVINSGLANPFWKSNVPKNVRVFLWILSQEKLSTCDRLQKKMPKMSLSPWWCVMCRKNLEKHSHLFLSCPFDSSVWSNMLSFFGISWCCPKDCRDALTEILVGSPFKGKAGEIWAHAVALWFREYGQRGTKGYSKERIQPLKILGYY